MTDITKEQIEDTLNIARMLDNRGLLDLRLVVKIKQLALHGLETQWKPIEQAPKDGTKVLGICVKAVDRKCSWADGHVAVMRYGQPKDKLGYAGWSSFNERCWPPTHFIPLSDLGEPK